MGNSFKRSESLVEEQCEKQGTYEYQFRSKEDQERIRVENDPELVLEETLMDLLEDTNCGCCSSPWLEEETLEAMKYVFEQYEKEK